MSLFEALGEISTLQVIFFLVALVVAFGFEFINGFHDTANAVATVIYTRTLPATPAVLFSGVMNFLGVLAGGTGVAFGIVHLLPVDLLVNANSAMALVMVLSLLLAGVIWNLGTWYLGLPVSSSHTLIGSILGVGLTNSLLAGNGISGVNWSKAGQTGLALLVSPIVGFVCAGGLLLIMKRLIREPKLYEPPPAEWQKSDGSPIPDLKPPTWIRAILISTCGGVSFAHGSNDGQKGMGLILLVLIGFLPLHYALDGYSKDKLAATIVALSEAQKLLADKPEALADLEYLKTQLAGKSTFTNVPRENRWEVRQAIFRTELALKNTPDAATVMVQVADRSPITVNQAFLAPIEFVPLWVKIGVALALGIGTTIGYQRIVITVAEKIGKTHLTYAQGAAAELVAAATILAADFAHAPVSTTQILSSGVAGTMAANRSGIQGSTVRKILLAWVFTLPCTIVLAGVLFAIGRLFV